MTYFTNCKTAEEIKAAYKKLVRQYHPDLNPNVDDSIIKAINSEYDRAWERLKNIHTSASGETYTKETDEAPEEFREIISNLMRCEGLTIELVGSWIWVTGDTFQHRETLKQNGFRWASRKKAWYWHRADEISKNRREMTLDEIKSLHGCETFRSAGFKRLTAC